jgi:hypothetical protein
VFLFSLAFEGEQYAVYLGWLDVGLWLIVDHGHRGHGAAADAGHCIQVKFTVSGGLPLVNIQPPFPGVQGDVAALHVAGGAQAYPYRVFPGRVAPELVIEGNHAVDLYLGYIEEAGNFQHSFPGEITKPVLDLLQNRDEVSPFSAEPAQNPSGFLSYFFCFLGHVVLPDLSLKHLTVARLLRIGFCCLDVPNREALCYLVDTERRIYEPIH